MVHIRRTPLSEIRRAAVYVNTDKLPLWRIVEDQKPDLAITAGFYNGEWQPVCPVKADGKVLFQDEQYDYWAIAWDEGADAVPLLIPRGTSGKPASYVANCVLITDGTPHERLYYNADVGGRRGRAAVGLTRGGEWLTFAATDGSKSAMTPEELRDYLAESQGCCFAIMMDGGGKVNCYDRACGVMMEGEDPSQTLILLWLNNEEKEEAPVSTKKVCLDAGHDASNRANASPDGTYLEHEFALDMAKRIKTILEAAGVQVTQTRPDGKAVSLGERCQIANAVQGLDLFVSLHSNAAGSPGWSGARGWECYVYGLSGARYEAAKAILARVRGTASAIRSTPVRAKPELYVLKHTSAPAVLIEHGFHTNREDAALLKDGAYRQALAEAEAYGILDYLGVPVPEIPQAPVVPEEKSEAELAVEWITGKGIMKGNEAGDLMLDQPLTRRQFAVMLYRYHKLT